MGSYFSSTTYLLGYDDQRFEPGRARANWDIVRV